MKRTARGLLAAGAGAALIAARVPARAAGEAGAYGIELDGGHEYARFAAPPPPTDASLPKHAEAVHRTTIAARLDPAAHVVTGEETIVWKNPASVAAVELYFHQYLNAFKNEKSVFLRSHLGSGRGERAPASWGALDIKSIRLRRADANAADARELWPPPETTSPGDPDDETDLRVPLPEPCPPGAEIVLDIRFEAKLPSVVERTGFFGSFHMVAQWFPKLAEMRPDGAWNHFTFDRLTEFASDYGHYDATLDVPEAFTIGATGVLADERVEGGRRKAHYVLDDAHDFAWSAWDEFRQRTTTLAGIAVRALYPAADEAIVAREIEAVDAAIGCYGRRYGPYPYPNLTIVHPPEGADEAGGMEYPTLITTGGPWFIPGWLKVPEFIALHEFGHQHFYGLIASDEHRWPFLDEGLNSYGESVCMEERYGRGSTLDLPSLRVTSGAMMREGANTAVANEPVAQATTDFATAPDYGALVYAQTATLLRSLGGAFGRDVVDDALGRYARQNRFRHPGPDELLGAFREQGGEPLASALRAGLFERATVDFAVEKLTTYARTSAGGLFDGPEGRTLVAPGPASGAFVGESVVFRRGTLVLPVTIEVGFDDGTTRRTTWDGQADLVRVRATGPSRPAYIIADPDHGIVLDPNWANNTAARSGRPLASRVFERLAFVFGVIASVLGP